MSEWHRNCEPGEIELSNRHPSCERVRLYTCSPAGNSSHSTVILWLACDRHSNDTTSHRASRPFFPIFQSFPSQDQRVHERKAADMKPFLNVRKLGARQQNIKLIAGLSNTLRHSKKNRVRSLYHTHMYKSKSG